MKYWLLWMLLFSGSVYAEFRTNDVWHGRDKAQHAIVGVAIGSAVTVATNRWEYGFAAGCAAGAVKEMHDYRHKQHHDSTFQDLAVTCLGAAIGSKLTHIVITPNSITYKHTFK